MNQHLLQVKTTPADYLAVTANRGGITPPPSPADYWQNIPEYVVARCPLCGNTYLDRLDTYSLKYWVRPLLGDYLFYQRAKDANCSHFVVVHHFINLNGVKPTELVYTELGCEVPHVISVFLPDDIESYAVMHALPICRIEEGQFVPRYSLYVITYYSEEPSALIKRRWQISSSEAMFGPDIVTKESWDLARWVRTGKLQWLDPRIPDLPLRAGPVEAFPYLGIEGHREDVNIYRDGEWQNMSFWSCLKRFIQREWRR